MFSLSIFRLQSDATSEVAHAKTAELPFRQVDGLFADCTLASDPVSSFRFQVAAQTTRRQLLGNSEGNKQSFGE